MHDLIAGASILPVLAAVLAAARAAAGCRPLPRMYGGGVDIADQPPTNTYGGQR